MRGNIEGNVNKAIFLDASNMTFDYCFVIGRSNQTCSKVCAYDTFGLAFAYCANIVGIASLQLNIIISLRKNKIE